MQDVFQFLSSSSRILNFYGFQGIRRSVFVFFPPGFWIPGFGLLWILGDICGYQGYDNGKIGLRYSYFESVCLQTPQRRLFVCRHLKRALFLGSAVAPTGGIHFQNPDFLKSSFLGGSLPYRANHVQKSDFSKPFFRWQSPLPGGTIFRNLTFAGGNNVHIYTGLCVSLG